MNLYISDLHFGHKNVIKCDYRPFFDVEEMDRMLIQAWNTRVYEEDHVYILGDFCYRNEKAEQWYLQRLKGHKHDLNGNQSEELRAVFTYMLQKERALNAGCMINHYTPVSMAELIENNKRYRNDIAL